MKQGRAPCAVHGHEPHVSGDHFIKARRPLSCAEESLTILVIEKPRHMISIICLLGAPA